MKATVLAFMLVAAGASQAQAQNWNSDLDFSCTENPNGAWRYGWSNSLSGTDFSLMPSAYSQGGLFPGCGWAQEGDNHYPGVDRTANVPIGQPAHTTLGNLSDVNSIGVVRWQAPNAGCHEIACSFSGFWQQWQIGADPAFGEGWLRINGTLNYVGAYGESGGAVASLSLQSVFLEAGDIVDVLHVGGRPRVALIVILNGSGNMNNDGITDNDDVPSFVEALVDPASFAVNHPEVPLLRGDMNCDGFLDGRDIQGFVNALLPP